MKYIRTRNGKCLAPMSGAEGGKPELLFVRDRAGLFGAPPGEGKSEEPLRWVARLREHLTGDLSEVEAPWEMVVEVGAKNQILAAEMGLEVA